MHRSIFGWWHHRKQVHAPLVYADSNASLWLPEKSRIHQGIANPRQLELLLGTGALGALDGGRLSSYIVNRKTPVFIERR